MQKRIPLNDIFLPFIDRVVSLTSVPVANDSAAERIHHVFRLSLSKPLTGMELDAHRFPRNSTPSVRERPPRPKRYPWNVN